MYVSERVQMAASRGGSKLRFEVRVRKGKHTGSLDVADDGTGLVVHELNANLGNTTARA